MVFEPLDAAAAALIEDVFAERDEEGRLRRAVVYSSVNDQHPAETTYIKEPGESEEEISAIGEQELRRDQEQKTLQLAMVDGLEEVAYGWLVELSEEAEGPKWTVSAVMRKDSSFVQVRLRRRTGRSARHQRS